MDELHRTLLELQELDRQIAEAEKRVNAFAPLIASVGVPALELDRDATTLRKQVSKLDHEVRLLERTAQEKHAKLTHHQEHADRVRNAREETAVRTAMEQVREAIDADEEQALEKMEVLEKLQPQLAVLEAKLATARAAEGPRRHELSAAHAAAAGELALIRSRRNNHAIRIDANVLKLYERLRGKAHRAVLAPMTVTGACGHCFNTLPVQEQSQIRQGGRLHHCEACGLVLYADGDGVIT